MDPRERGVRGGPGLEAAGRAASPAGRLACSRRPWRAIPGRSPVPAGALCYNACVDTTIRNLDERAYRALKARAALSGRTIGETLNEAIELYLARPTGLARTGSLADLEPRDYPEGNERLSERLDAVMYGT